MIPITIEGLHKKFGEVTALNGISLRIEKGELFFLLGPSGCGKTTLLRHIAGFYMPDSGRIFFGDEDVTQVPPHKRNTGMMFQSYALWPHMTVAKNVAFGLEERRMPSAEIKKQVEAALESVQMQQYADRKIAQLSGGQQQRVALARALVIRPRCLLLDEPLSALDVKLKKVLQAELKRLHRSVGVTFVHVTHDLEEAMMLADRICVMRAGKILQLGEPADIYYRPADPFVAGFIGETNLMPVTVTGRSGAQVSYESGEVVDAQGSLPASLVAGDVGQGPALMNVRPELIRRCEPDAAVDCKLPATVTEVFTKGGTMQYRARSPQGLELAIEIQGTSHLPMQLGEDVWLGWAKKDIWVLKPGEA